MIRLINHKELLERYRVLHENRRARKAEIHRRYQGEDRRRKLRELAGDFQQELSLLVEEATRKPRL
jgi:hypothetical protein